MGKVATSPLPPQGSPPLQCRGQIQKWPINGQGGYVTPAASGIPSASERGAKSEVAHKWARWLRHPSRLGDPLRFSAGVQIQKWPINGQGGYITPPPRGSPPLQSGGQIEVAHLWARWLHHPPPRGSHPLPSGVQNQKWPINGQGAYVTPAASRIPSLQSGVQNQKWPINGQGGYVTPPASGIPSASVRGANSEVAHKMGKVATSPLPPRGSPSASEREGKFRSGP